MKKIDTLYPKGGGNMIEKLYSVMEGNTVIAEHMTIEHALLLVKALFEQYYNERDCSYIIHLEEQEKEENQ